MKEILYAGFDRLDITPKNGGIPLAGFGTTFARQADTVLDRIYCNTLALGNGETVEVVLLTLDWINVSCTDLERYRAIIHEATGIPAERILLGGTHTHSGPDIYSSMDSIRIYKEYVDTVIASTVKRAIRDMKPAKVFYGKIPAGHEGAWLNFVKHYKMAPIEKKDCWTEEDLVDCGDNYGHEYAKAGSGYFYVRHEEEADHDLQVIRLVREDTDDILMVNFQAHAMITGMGRDETKKRFNHMSSDFPGVMCLEVERIIPNTHCIFYQGAAGNLNPCTRIAEEGIIGLTDSKTLRDARPYASVLAAHVKKACQNLTESETNAVAFATATIAGVCDHTEDYKLEKAKEIYDLWIANAGTSPEIQAMCRANGFNSPAHVHALIGKAARGETEDILVNAVRIGDVGFATAPCEMFNTNQLFVKAHSPFKMTFVKAYSCGRVSYIPSINTYYNSYERNCTHFVPGTGEIMADKMVELLEEVKRK